MTTQPTPKLRKRRSKGRTETLHIRVSPDEQDQALFAAAKRGMTVSEYGRQKIFYE
jgi:hypothetical protein